MSRVNFWHCTTVVLKFQHEAIKRQDSAVARRPIKGWKQQKKQIVLHTGGCFSFVGCYQPLFVCFNNQRHFSISTKYFFFSCSQTGAKSEPQQRQHWKRLKWSLFMKRVFKGTPAGECERLHKNRRQIIRGEKQQMNKMIKTGRRCQKRTVTHRTTDAGKYLSEVWFVLLQPSWYHLIVAISFILLSAWCFFFLILLSEAPCHCCNQECNNMKDL